jgi:hypothetical protein
MRAITCFAIMVLATTTAARAPKVTTGSLMLRMAMPLGDG